MLTNIRLLVTVSLTGQDGICTHVRYHRPYRCQQHLIDSTRTINTKLTEVEFLIMMATFRWEATGPDPAAMHILWCLGIGPFQTVGSMVLVFVIECSRWRGDLLASLFHCKHKQEKWRDIRKKRSDFRCRRKPEYPEETCEVGYGSATKLTYEQGRQWWEVSDLFTTPAQPP